MMTTNKIHDTDKLDCLVLVIYLRHCGTGQTGGFSRVVSRRLRDLSRAERVIIEAFSCTT